MNHTIEGSTEWKITFIGCHKEKESENCYKIVDQNHNEKDGIDVNILDPKEIKTYNCKIDIDRKKGIGKQTNGVAISNIDQIIQGLIVMSDEKVELNKIKAIKQEYNEK